LQDRVARPHSKSNRTVHRHTHSTSTTFSPFHALHYYKAAKREAHTLGKRTAQEANVGTMAEESQNMRVGTMRSSMTTNPLLYKPELGEVRAARGAGALPLGRGSSALRAQGQGNVPEARRRRVVAVGVVGWGREGPGRRATLHRAGLHAVCMGASHRHLHACPSPGEEDHLLPPGLRPHVRLQGAAGPGGRAREWVAVACAREC
jgi:hypothetical protein